MDERQLELLREAALSSKSVSGLTHKYYRYPARFSPLFAREAIKTFSSPGDLILDPYMGGATTLVEARALGRRVIGSDINSLSLFLSRVKTRILSDKDIDILTSWNQSIGEHLNIHRKRSAPRDASFIEYYRNVNSKQTWRIRKVIDQYLAMTSSLPTIKQQEFARCLLLRTAQWALDGRKMIPSVPEFRKAILFYFNEMIAGMRTYRSSVREGSQQSGSVGKWGVRRWNFSVEELAANYQRREPESPKLIIMSPPYPGVHMLYHRWQILGRKETPLPFVIANCKDGAGFSFYTMGGRHERGLKTYFDRQYTAFQSLAKIASEKTLMIQMLGFSRPSLQLARYLEIMVDAGFEEVMISQLSTSDDGRLWRDVPNRKWNANQKGKIGSSKEVILFHHLR